MAKLTIEELNKIRKKEKKKSLVSKEGPYNVKVTVHMGTCGIAAGARDIMNTFMEEIEEKNAKMIYLTTSGCAGLCSHEPMVTVEFADQIPVKYIDLTPEKAKKIFKTHIMDQKPVLDYALGAGSERSI
ncbi:MAG: (2Fe-2S) ferredoxin domain-containing protein [Candidatus Aminicenantes bacterium]|nr:(2Fe-2S) ferredoxin domain-containing protein [Candidatus Aminicenantes bacterium]